MKKSIPIFIAISLLSGCAATGPKYTEQISKLPQLDIDNARIFVFRTDEFKQYLARSASVKTNGNKIGVVDYKGFNVFNVPVTTKTLGTDLFDSPGNCFIAVELNPGSEYFYEIKPRSGNLFSVLAGGLIGAAIESSGKECGGAFSIESVLEGDAKAKLSNLNLTVPAPPPQERRRE